MNDPFRDFDRIFRHMEELMKSSFSGGYQYSDRNQRVKQVDDLLINHDRNTLSFTLDLAPVKNKEDIIVDVTKDTLGLTVLLDGQEKHHSVNLPLNVKPKTTKTTFINGVLDVEISLEDSKTETSEE